MTNDIFIIYRNKDLVIAHEILNWLHSDKNVTVGIYQTDKEFQKEQVDAILDQCNNVVVLLSNNCFDVTGEDYKWYTYSIQRSVVLDKTILPVNINGSFSEAERKEQSNSRIYIESLFKNSELVLDSINDLYTGIDRIGVWYDVKKQKKPDSVFIDIGYGKNEEEKSFIEEIKRLGIVFYEPVDARETGTDICKLIQHSSLMLYVVGLNDSLRIRNIEFAKKAQIPYWYIILDEKQDTSKIPHGDQNKICHFYKENERINLFSYLDKLELVKNNIPFLNTEIMNTSTKSEVFISYINNDKLIAQKITNDLVQNGYKVFDETCLPVGSKYLQAIKDTIEESKYFIVLLSAKAVESEFVLKEVSIALNSKKSQPNKKIIPLNIDRELSHVSGQHSSPVMMELMTIQWGNFDTFYYEASLSRLLKAMKRENPRIIDKCEIFLAYPRLDRVTGDKVTAILERNGFSVWRDETGIETCDEFAHVIFEAISNAKVFLLIESKWSKDSKWVQSELEYARSKKKHVISVITDNEKGLEGVRRMNFSALALEVGDTYFEEKLLSTILSKGCIANTQRIFDEGEQIYKSATQNSSVDRKEKELIAFLLFLRATELGHEGARGFIEKENWMINLKDAVSQYHEIYTNFICDLKEGLYNRGEIIAEDPTLPDVPSRGRGMEQAAARFMQRAIDLGYNGQHPRDYMWHFLDKSDFPYTSDETESIVQEEKDIKISKKIYYEDPNKIEDNKDQETLNLTNKIFISYKRVDKDIVFPIVDDIYRRTGIKCWIDLEGIESGDQFQKVIINAIDNAEIVVFMLSKNFIAPYTDPKTGKVNYKKQTFPEKEVMYAIRHDKWLVPVSIDGTMPPDCKWLDFNCSGLDSIDYNNEDQRNKFFRDVSSWLGVKKQKEESSVSKLEDVHTSNKEESDNKSADFFDDSIELQLAWLDYDNGNYKEALKQFLLVAKTGSANALNAIGIYYYEGKACKKNYQQAMGYFQKAADLGYASAMRNIGDCYRFGHGVTKSMTNAIRWYQQAAEKKNLKAIFLLAECLAKSNPDKYKRYQEAAHMGHEEAAAIIENAEEFYKIGYRYYTDDRDSEGIEKCAYCNLMQAAEYGHPEANKLTRNKGLWSIDTENVWKEYCQRIKEERYKDIVLVSFEENKKYGFKDASNGTVYIAPEYDDTFSRFSESKFPVKKYNKWGFITKSNEIALPFIYEGAFPFQESIGLASIKQENSWGCINNKGDVVIPCIYDTQIDFSDGLAHVVKEGLNGFINIQGKEIIPCIYEDAYVKFREGCTFVKKDGKWGYINKNGEEILPFVYDSVEPFNNGKAKVIIDNTTFYIDKEGHTIE